MKSRIQPLRFLLAAILALGACDSREATNRVEESDSAQATSFAAGPNGKDKGLEELERGARSLPLKGDLDSILDRGYIRVLVPYSKTYFFYEGAKLRGMAYQFMEEFAKSLGKVARGRTAALTVVYLPTARDRLIPGITDGLGDIAIGGLTATDDRKREVDFITHPSHKLSEIVVTGPDAPTLQSVEDLSGHNVFVRPSSSYYQSLQKLNARLRSSGRKEVKIVEADENLEVEDILELVRSGVEQITITDDFLARFWSEVMGGLTVHEDIAVTEGAPFGPVVRKQSPQLVAALRKFQKTHGLGTEFGNVVVNRYLKTNPWVRNPNASADRKRFEQTIPIFRKYGGQYGFDELLLVAQGYQESGLNQSMRSRGGAVGVMQIKPSSAAGQPINIGDVERKIDNNIHAGAKYLRHLVDDYFNEPGITPFNRHVFAIAAYNAGPARIQSLRRKAAERGLDPNVWFNNVELVSAQAIGRQNVDYVRNILKYWVAYRLAAGLDKT